MKWIRCSVLIVMFVLGCVAGLLSGSCTFILSGIVGFFLGLFLARRGDKK